MDRYTAHKLTKDELSKHGLLDWGVRITNDANHAYLGMCSYKDKVIFINAFHVDIHPDAEVVDTILHEVAHALMPGHAHDSEWAAKAREIGCTNTLPCSHLTFPDHVIDAIRSGMMVEMTVEEEVQIIRRPKYTVTQLKDMCPDCGKVAKELFAIETTNTKGDIIKLITLQCFHVITKIIPRGTPYETMVSNDWEPHVKDCQHDWLKNQCSKCREFRLFDFQVTGARNAESGLSMQRGFGVFDDMGLGKTVQALAVIKFHPELYTPTLYVVKSSITFQWLKQIFRWLGPDFMGQIIKTGKDFILPGLKTYIISYDLIKRMPPEKLKKIGFKLIVLDECQQIKNPDSTRTQEVRKLVGLPNVKVMALSGTPWKNRGSEFFPALNMIDPVKFYSYQQYLDTWVDYYWEGNKRKMGGIKNVKRFREYTNGLLIRREFNEVMEEFPEINRMKLNVQLDTLSQSTYDDEVSDFVKWYNDAIIGGEEDTLNGLELLAKITRMRHITGLAKIPATLGFVEQFIEETDKKLVIFVHHKDVGEIMINSLTTTNPKHEWFDLAEDLRKQGIKVMKLTAEFNDGERYTIQQTFNDTTRVVMVASTLASGEGIDLQTCADSVMHERQWNPQNEDQATPGRFRRIGQLSKVINVTFTEAEGTIDEYIDVLVEGKRVSYHAAMNKSEIPTWNQGDFTNQLAEMIVTKYNSRHKDKPASDKKVKSLTSQASFSPANHNWESN